ncbi:MAG: hypothetical protein J5928_04365 [Firmicutes bacterium]|nr:hypothetical protein [Bacillota bacterium]
MKMIDILEKDKDNLLTELTRAGVPERAAGVLETELDKLLLKYNEQASSDRERDAAAYMVKAVRHSLPLVDAVGETKVWEMQEGAKARHKVNPVALILLVAGLICAVLTLIFMNSIKFKMGMSVNDLKLAQPETFLLLATVVCILAFGLFRRIGTVVPKKNRKQQVEIKIDADKVYRSIHTAVLSIDQSLEEVQAQDRWAKKEQAGTIEGKAISSGETDLFADLLTAAYSKDGEYALEKIEDLKYYLHKQQIEVMDYGEETKQYFDIMPGTQTGTIRPALVADGKVLKKGLASRGR